jgi:hypothetical protein
MAMALLKRYWFEFVKSAVPLPLGTNLGAGVTAFNYEDAVSILKSEIFENIPFPEVKNLIEDVDLLTLDAGHVLPNVGPSNLRGVWYPFLYLH